jgi:hypothetical protein
MTIGRAARDDFSLLECSQRLNGPHCPHQIDEHAHSADMQCCWCGTQWTEPRSQTYDRHGTYLPSRTREGGGRNRATAHASNSAATR